MKVKGTISDYKRRRGNSERILETLTNIFFKDNHTGVIRKFDRKMQLIDETPQAEKDYKTAIRKKQFTWQPKKV